jgi:ATP-dependent exoDNAse (exonuclease V) alpha subunit
MQEQVRGQVIWVDEAGLISSGDMKRLMDVARDTGSRVILSGDYTQHASVEAGDAFRLLEQEAGVKLARLTQVRRQTEKGYKKAVEAIARGSGKAAQKGFDALDAMGCVVEASGEERHKLLVADYVKSLDDKKTGLIIAPTHAEGGRLTGEVREALKERGDLGRERGFLTRRSTGWTQAQKGDARNFQTGMIVEFNQNAKGFKKGDKTVVISGGSRVLLQRQDGTQAVLPQDKPAHFEVYRPREMAIAPGERIRITRNGEVPASGKAKAVKVNNGDIYTVEGFDRQGNLRLQGGKVLPKGYGHFAYGYVDTSYASQGKTVDRVFIATGHDSLPAVGQQQWYVSVTRGREMAKVYVEDKQEVRDRIARGGERLSAVEFTGTKIRATSGADALRTLTGYHRFTRFVKAQARALAGYLRERERDQGGMRRA